MSLPLLYLLRYLFLGMALLVVAYLVLTNVFGKNRKP